MRAMREQPELLARLRKEQAEYARSIGLNQDEAAEKGKTFMQSLRRLEMVVTLVSQKILSDLAPALQEFIDKIIEWVRQNPDTIREGLIQIGNAATEFAKALMAIAKELAPVITKIGEMAGAITGHGGVQGVLEAFAAFMVASWAVRIIGAISSVSTAWGALMLRLGIPIVAGAVAMGHSFQTPEQAAADPGQAELQREGIDRRARVREWLGEKWGSVKRAFGGGGAEASEGGGGAGIRRRGARAAAGDQSGGVAANPGDYKDVLDHIARSEGTAKAPGGGYNTSLANGLLLPGGKEQDLTKKTLDEIDALQTEMLRNPSNRWNSSAIGRYQVVRTTLRAQRAALGLKGTDLYDAALQDRIGANLAKARGADPVGLRQEWASLVGAKNAIAVELMQKVRAGASINPRAPDKPDFAAAAKGLDRLMSPEDRAAAAAADAARAEAAKARAAMTDAQRDALDREKRERWQAVYKATGDAAKADEAMRKVGTRVAAMTARPPTFAPAIDAKPLGTGGSTDNSRSASLTQHNTFHVQGSEPRQVADLVFQGQKAVGKFGIEGIQSAIR